MHQSRAWLVVVLLWPVALLNYLDRQMLATLKTSVMAEIADIGSNERFGLILATFMWVYALLSPFGGYVGDRFDRRWTIIFSLLVWSAVTFATGLARSFEELILLRGLMGVSEAFYIPTALALITDFHPSSTRTRAVGFHQTGIYVGVALGGLGGIIAQQSGSWRNSFYSFGLIGIFYAGFLIFALPRSSATESSVQGSSHPPPHRGVKETMRALFGQWAFWLMLAYFTLPAISGWLMRNWLPTHLQDAFGRSEAEAGVWANATPVLGNVLGLLIGGWLADRWSAYSSRGRIFASACGTATVTLGLIVLALATTFPQAILGMLLFGIGWVMFDANNMPILCLLVRPEYRATGYGFLNMVSIATGAQATVFLGGLKDRGVPFEDAFLGSAAVAAFAACLVLWVRPRNVTSS